MGKSKLVTSLDQAVYLIIELKKKPGVTVTNIETKSLRSQRYLVTWEEEVKT